MPSRIVYEERFDDEQQAFSRAIQAGLVQGSHIIAADAKRQPTGYRIGSILATIKADPVRPRPKGKPGWETGASSDDHRLTWFERGTYQRRRAKLKRPRKPTASTRNRGVKPGFFLRRGLKAATPKIVAAIERQLRLI